MEYRVFDLPRLHDDPKDGFARLVVSGGLKPARFHEEVDEYLERWEEAVDD